MRSETRERLFRDGDVYKVLRVESLDDGGTVSWIVANGSVAVVHDWPNPRDGFEVFTSTPNNLDETRRALGFNV